MTSRDVSDLRFDRTVTKVGNDALVPVVTIMMSLRGNGISQTRTLALRALALRGGSSFVSQEIIFLNFSLNTLEIYSKITQILL